MELHGARQYGPHAPQPIGFAEIEAWARLTRREPQAWEIELLRELDMLWLNPPKKDESHGDRGHRSP